jgi:uncharacterized protein YndB with AHSA1/START domain
MTSDTTVSVQVRHRFDASPERVFDAWLDPKKAHAFLFATPSGRMVRADIDARVGGAFTFVDRRDGEDVEHTGTYVEIDRPRRLVFTFSVPKYSAMSTRVTIEIVPLGTGCELTLTHEGVLPEYAAPSESGWNGILDGLASALSENAPRAAAGDAPASTIEQPTCGAGIAAHAALPATLGELLTAMADVLDTHQQTLDLTDENTHPEHHAYLTMALEFRAMSAQLAAIARRMVGFRNLPMGKHDEQMLSSRTALAPFERFVGVERKLLSQLNDAVGQHETMLHSIP